MQLRLHGFIALGVAALLVAGACGGGTTTTTAPTTAPQRTPRVGSFDRPIVFAFTPSQDVQRVTASGNAIASALAAATALRWKATVPTSYAAQIESMCAGQTDIAAIAPLQMSLLLQKGCGTPILSSLRRDENGQLATTYQSQILVRTDSGINSLADLKGKRFAFVDPVSASGYLFPTLTVKQKTGQDPKTYFSQTIFAGGHDKAALAVYSGQVDAAATFIDVRTSAGMPADIMQKTKAIEKAGPIPNDGVAVAKTFPAELNDQIAQALIDYCAGAGKAPCKSLFGWDGLQKVGATFYDPIREAAQLAGVDVAAEAAKTPRPAATPTPAPTKSP